MNSSSQSIHGVTIVRTEGLVSNDYISVFVILAMTLI